MIQVPLMKTINFATKADISDRFYSGNIREIVNTSSYSCEKMCMHKLCSSGKKIRILNNSLRLGAPYGIILFSEKVPKVVVYFCQKCYDACIF